MDSPSAKADVKNNVVNINTKVLRILSPYIAGWSVEGTTFLPPNPVVMAVVVGSELPNPEDDTAGLVGLVVDPNPLDELDPNAPAPVLELLPKPLEPDDPNPPLDAPKLLVVPPKLLLLDAGAWLPVFILACMLAVGGMYDVPAPCGNCIPPLLAPPSFSCVRP